MWVFRKGQPSKWTWSKYQYFKFTTNCKRVRADMLTEPGGIKIGKEEYASLYDKKCLQLGFTVTPCSKQMPRPWCFACSKFNKRCNETFLTCSPVVTFIRSTAIIKASHWIIFKDCSKKRIVKKANKTMKAAEKSFLNASDLCSIEISKIKKHSPLGKS